MQNVQTVEIVRGSRMSRILREEEEEEEEAGYARAKRDMEFRSGSQFCLQITLNCLTL